MGATYTRQSTYADGDTITAAHTNDEFDQLLAAFQASTGHTHDGTANEGGPITKLLGNTLTFGAATSGTDITITFDGESNDGVLKWMEDEDYFEFSDDILIASTEKIQFRDTAIYINSSTDGQLDLVADTEIQIAATTIDIDGAVDISGNTTIGGSLIIGGSTLSSAELTYLDGVTAGTVAASKAVVVDANKDAASFRNVTLTGELDAATLDISGNADIDGTTNLDAVDIDGTVQIDGATTFGVDDTGVDVKFFGSTSGAYLLWDESADKLLTAGGAVVDIVKDKLHIGGTAITTTAAELNVLDAVTAGTVTANLGVVVDSNKDIGSFRNVTLTGELDAGSLDISGNADIDGTTNLDAVDIDGAVQIDNTVTIGADDQGYDVIFYGDTASANMTWDTSVDDLILNGAARIVIPDGQLVLGSTAVSSTAAELNILDGKSFLDEDDMSSDSATGIASQQSIKAYVDNNAGMTSFQLEDDDGTEVAISNAKEVKIIGDGVTTNWTDTDNGTDGDPYDLTISVNAAQTNITSLLASGIKIGEDNETKIDFEDANEIHFYANNVEQVYLGDNIFGPQSDSDVDLGTTGVRWKDAFIDTITTTSTITSGGKITADAGIDIDNFNIDGTTIALSSGDMTLDGAADIVLDAGGDQIIFKDGSANIGQVSLASDDLTIESLVQDKDIIFKGDDGGSGITALTLDMSEAGAATFNNDVTAFSDRRLKTDISNIENGIEKVMQMQGVYYKRNDQDDAKMKVGVIAQDMETIVPEVVLTANDEMQTKSVDYGKLTAVLIEAVKELTKRVEELENGVS
jgi:cytoskeletal protein CcmA (bactofilin family)